MGRKLGMIALAASAVWLLCAAPAALAASMNGAKAAGEIGEQPDGMLGLVDANAPADVKALVKDVNAQRRAKYQAIATENGISVDAVAARAGAKLIERTPPGQYVMERSGSWVKK